MRTSIPTPPPPPSLTLFASPPPRSSTQVESETAAILEMEGVRCADFEAEVLACLPPTPWNVGPQHEEGRADFRCLVREGTMWALCGYCVDAARGAIEIQCADVGCMCFAVWV